MVKIWIGNIAPLLEPKVFDDYYKLLPEHRKKKADMQMVPLKKAQSVGAWILWSRMKEGYGLTDENIYSLSHSGDYVICSTVTSGNKEVKLGCDIQRMEDYNEKLPRRFFTLSEIGRIEQEPTIHQQKEVFYRLWVLKESFQKATRLGMKLDMRSFQIALGNPSEIIKQPKEFHQKYYCYEIETQKMKQKLKLKDYKIAVCATETKMDDVLCEYSFRDENFCSHPISLN